MNPPTQTEMLLARLSPRIGQALRALPPDLWAQVQEVRLLQDKLIMLTINGRCRTLDSICPAVRSTPVSLQEIEQSFASLCEYSVHTYLSQIQNGYITVRGGHRIGLGGTAVMQGEKVHSMRDIRSMNIRLARQEEVDVGLLADRLYGGGRCSVLVAGEPGSGKTTVLRALALWLSEQFRVTVVDERGELIDRTARGGCIDVLRGFPKAIGILQAVRTLSPQVVVCDEVGSGEEVRGLLEAVNCGVSLLASIHAGSMEQLLLRPQFHSLQQSSTFEKIVLLQGAHAPTAVETVYKVQGERLVEI